MPASIRLRGMDGAKRMAMISLCYPPLPCSSSARPPFRKRTDVAQILSLRAPDERALRQVLDISRCVPYHAPCECRSCCANPEDAGGVYPGGDSARTGAIFSFMNDSVESFD
jgi:hypothetical protein